MVVEPPVVEIHLPDHQILQGNAKNLDVLSLQFPVQGFDVILTSPPYWKRRDYEHDEQLGQEDAARIGLALLNKVPVLSTDEHRAICGDLEGMLVLDDGNLLLANDSDYGIEGACTQFWLISTNLPPHAPAH